jgi:hypothetical protein
MSDHVRECGTTGVQSRHAVSTRTSGGIDLDRTVLVVTRNVIGLLDRALTLGATSRIRLGTAV